MQVLLADSHPISTHPLNVVVAVAVANWLFPVIVGITAVVAVRLEIITEPVPVADMETVPVNEEFIAVNELAVTLVNVLFPL